MPDHVDELERAFQQLKATIHQQLVESLDLTRFDERNQDRLLVQIRALADRVSKTRPEILGKLDRERLLDELLAEIFGLGPLESLMQDPTITDILVNGPYTVYIERRGRLELTNILFADDEHLLRIIRRLVARLGRRIDEVSPMVDARLPDGSRVNAVIPPIALDGPTVSIRRFGAKPLEMDDLLANQSIMPEMVEFMDAAVAGRVGCLISGGTGAGKTTLLNALSAAIPGDERLVTIEDSAELILQHRHRVRMETRPANTEGSGELSQRDLVRNSLRMRPDRIIVGEVRGSEVWDMLQAMNTGHEGSMTTIHANSAVDALARLEMMVAMTGYELPIGVVRQYIASGITLIVHAARLKGGRRRVMRVAEITGVRDGAYVMNDIFGFRQTGVNDDGMAVGSFYTTGYRPQCLERIEYSGIHLPEAMFEKSEREVI
ncbi:MAG: CpaF family protein [Planctomycetales bacterium]|nr:CpaF family protein [Planctomycetales bacterium]MCA9204300.1 CpaF family protein [Planctomycetales bacterium]MCA9220786.1 CpaF family protein [Planctomycetales bacterium]